jgi:hypothetical protein
MRGFIQAVVVSLYAFIAGAATAAQIADTPAMGPAGKQSFTATPGSPGAAINWTVDRVTRSENNGGGEAVKRNVYRATGPNVTFDLKKVSGKQTIWRIRATDSAGADTQEVQVFPANKLSSFTFTSTGNPVTRVYLVVPGSVDAQSKLLFVLHGQSRNANDYCNYWRNWTVDRGILLVCPRFADNHWPGGRGYNRGNVFANDADTRLNPEDKWSFTVLEKIHVHVRNKFSLDDPRYDIWGHSAGAQFIERFMLFKPQAKYRLAMMANAGWYMMPSLSIDYQCGARHPQLGFTQQALLDFSEKNAVVFRGTEDTDPNDPETGGCMDAQGKGRFARAGYFYNGVKALNPQTSWLLVNVPNVDHDGERMSEAAQDWLDDQD